MWAPPSHRRLGAAFALSILLHLAGVWLADQVSLPEDQPPGFAVRLMPPDRPYERRFERREGLSVPRQQPSRADPSLHVPRPNLEVAAPVVDTVLADRSLAAAERLQPLPEELAQDARRDPSAVSGWQDDAWLSWRDSLFRESRAVEKYRIPFDIEREGRRSVVALDPETGRLERAQCYIPVYRHCARAPLDPRGYNHRLLTLSERLRVIPTRWGDLHDADRPVQPSQADVTEPDSTNQLIAHLDARFELRCRTKCDVEPCVKPDAIHTFREDGCSADAGRPISPGAAATAGSGDSPGRGAGPSGPTSGGSPTGVGRGCNHTCRDVLSFEEMSLYPVALLEFMDAESTGELARYLLEGGFAVLSARQLELVQGELARQLALSVPRGEIRAHVIELMERGGMGKDQPGFAERYSDLSDEVLQKLIEHHLKSIEIWSDHPLMEAYYPIGDYQPQPGSRRFAPLVGLELNGRLLAVARIVVGRGGRVDYRAFLSAEKNSELFVNAVVYGLTQPRGLAARRTVK